MAGKTPATPSITSTETFAARAQRGEYRRVLLWTGVLAAVLALNYARRLAGGVVAGEPRVFWSSIGLLGLGIAVQIALAVVLRRANRQGRLLGPWLWRGGAAFDLFLPMAMMLVLHQWSPLGPVAVLSAPVVMLFPMVILLSVLRLKPAFTLGLGAASAGFHLVLTVATLSSVGAAANVYPAYLTYGVSLLLIGIAGMLVAREVRGHVLAELAEAEARESAERQTAMLRRDMSIAGDIQKGLLPTAPPKFPGYDIAGMNRPADMAGGDYYDWQVLPDGRLLTVMADVSGHGIGPALVMAVCRAYARASAGLITDPSPLMRRLNELLESDLPAGRFITLAIAIVSPDGHTQLLSAGHGPTLLYRAATKQVEVFGGDGVPLGVSSGEEYTPATQLTLGAGDVLVMLTDGFHEWQRQGDGECFGTDRLSQTFADATSAGHSAAEIIRRIDRTVADFAAGAGQQDDTTALVIRRLT